MFVASAVKAPVPETLAPPVVDHVPVDVTGDIVPVRPVKLVAHINCSGVVIPGVGRSSTVNVISLLN